MVMWIVLGSLVGVVVIFLIVTSTLDRKKSKKLNEEKATLAKEIVEASPLVTKKINAVIKANDKSIKNFVPSVGKVKMADINKSAKDGLKNIKSSKDFKLLKHDEDTYTEFSNNIDALISTKSNNWPKRCKDELKFFATYKPPVQETNDKKGKKSKKDKAPKTVKTEVKAKKGKK